ncbi:MAG: response regulator [Proteobacteria bacterium]|nr:response regulator [Desulfobulbaceae bacterium]MBU4152445.1 response regulator [Pseudomonadota bacterium]
MKKVLLVDDRPEDRRLLRLILEHQKLQVSEATDGLNALEHLKTDTPDLVISDALMPKMDGFTLLRTMKSDPGLSTIPFVFYSATYTSKDEHELATKLGAASFLTKPLEPATLWRQLSEIIKKLGEPPPVSQETINNSSALLETYAAMVASKLERKVHELEAITTKWERTFNSLHDILTLLDTDMRITQANNAAGECFSTQPENLIGKFCYEVFSGCSEPCPNCPIVLSIQDRQPHSGIITHKALGKIFSVSSAPVIGNNNAIEYIIHVARDITIQKRLEEDLFQSHKMEAMGTLAGGIAHDFNNILGAILGYAELTQQKLLGGGERPLAEINGVIEAALRARELVSQILNFSRKGGTQQLGPMNPSPMIKEALKFLRVSLPTTMAIVDKINSQSGVILADPTKIHQIVINLCTNAFQSLPDEKGTITITLERRELTRKDLAAHPRLTPGPYLELTVQDTGAGIAADTLPHIFEPYFTTKARGRGTGLGLAVVYGIVDALGGIITVESEPGHGTTFRIYFQALPDSKNKSISQAAKPTSPSLPTCNARIMVVDDDPMIVTMLHSILERLGHHVTPFLSSLDALTAFTSTPNDFDLLITDQTMPGLTGAELTVRVRALRPKLPIILCTGFSNVLSEDQAKALGITSYLTKPITINTLSDTVQEALSMG